MQLAFDLAQKSLAKEGEELCGDTVEVLRRPNEIMVALSDGLGSGVKAGILSTMTVKLASTLLSRGLPLDDVMATINQTLPVCKERGLAYATLAVLASEADGETRLLVNDSPQALLLRDNELLEPPFSQTEVGEKQIQQSQFQLQEGDLLFLFSDGVTHAGVGGVLELGWGMAGLRYYLQKKAPSHLEPEQWAHEILDIVNILYQGRPGDDATVVVLRARQPRSMMLLSGPPEDKELDEELCNRLREFPGQRVIAGGATGNMVARHWNERLQTQMNYEDPTVPPKATLTGAHLVTEGILTLNKVIDRLRLVLTGENIPPKEDGASCLARELLRTEEIHFLIGTALNPAFRSLQSAVAYPTRQQAIGELSRLLTRLGKKTTVEWY